MRHSLWLNLARVTGFLLLVLLSFAYAMFQGGFVSWFLFYSFLPFALYGLAMSFWPMRSIRVQRTLVKTTAVAGESVQVSLHFERTFPFPLFFMVIYDVVADETLPTFKGLSFPGLKRKWTFTYHQKEVVRGEHEYATVQLRVFDLLHLVEKRTDLPVRARLLVYPYWYDLELQMMQSLYEQGSSTSKQNIQRDTSVAIGVREYQPGDRFSLINWKASAKRDDLMTKEFEQRRSHDVLVVFDVTPHPAFELGVSFAASYVQSMAKKGTQIGVRFSGNELVIPPREGREHVNGIMLQLAKLSAKKTSFASFLQHEQASLHQASRLVLVTPVADAALLEAIGGIGGRKSISLFIPKAVGHVPTSLDRQFKALARSRKVDVEFVHDRKHHSFSEVKQSS
ncbi:DUF58 domain-containing protein [Bacillus fonticola]|uniref:DUF58 domain-containing protein n=1 Tax=Bacillus fonticola TaxID=2728853 RepID=UPI0014765D48|nr:DUF58 domain-containing protein [Bacillus fonticola]